MVQGRSAWFDCQGSGYPDGFYGAGFDRANGGPNTPAIPDDEKWLCHEAEVDIDGGIVRFWINDKLVGQEKGNLKGANNPGLLHTIRFYRERGLGDLYFDDLVVSNYRIGCK